MSSMSVQERKSFLKEEMVESISSDVQNTVAYLPLRHKRGHRGLTAMSRDVARKSSKRSGM